MAYLGGSFAPPLSSGKLEKFRKLANNDDNVGTPIGEVIIKLCDMVEIFHETPDSTLPGTPHPSGLAFIIPLEQEEIDRMWEFVPWRHEVESYRRLFDEIPTENKELRDAAFHLLWFAVELEKDREPQTTDKIKIVKPEQITS